MTSQDLEAIFRDLEKVSTISTEGQTTSTSVGLGISIVSRIVRRLGGQFRIESTPGSGTCVHVSMPLLVPEGENQNIAIDIPTEPEDVNALVSAMLQCHMDSSTDPHGMAEQVSHPTAAEPMSQASTSQSAIVLQAPQSSVEQVPVVSTSTPRSLRERASRRPALLTAQTATDLDVSLSTGALKVSLESSSTSRRPSPPQYSRHKSLPLPDMPRYSDSERLRVEHPPLKVVVVEVSSHYFASWAERDC